MTVSADSWLGSFLAANSWIIIASLMSLVSFGGYNYAVYTTKTDMNQQGVNYLTERVKSLEDSVDSLEDDVSTVEVRQAESEKYWSEFKFIIKENTDALNNVKLELQEGRLERASLKQRIEKLEN